ncbi:MAG: spore germination protein GerW family protein [Deltaproteobacteria bacterium]|nr:spore germination protein GerW family protein [Deltaproteobacteria bacterium]
MKEKIIVFLVVGLFLFPMVFAETQAEKKPQAQPKAPLPMFQLADAMGQRLTSNLNVKTVVGSPMKVGKVTLIPILMIEIGFGGGGGGAPQNPELGGKGFYMKGEAQPIGFVVITKQGTKFISVGRIPAK